MWLSSDTLKHLVHSEKKRKEWDERLSSLRSEASDRDNQKWHKRRARSRLELQCEKATSIFAGIEEAYRQSSRSQSISAAAASFTNANAPSLPQRPTKPVTNQRHLLPAYMSGNRAENSFTEYDRLVDRLEAQIGARVMAVAREREHFYSMQRHAFESQQDLFLQCARLSPDFHHIIHLYQQNNLYMRMQLRTRWIRSKLPS